MNTQMWVKAVLAVGACCAYLGGPGRAAAQGVEIGGRVGFGFPMGEVIGGQGHPDNDLSDLISGQLPLTLDVGYRLNKELFVGAYGSYGFGFVPNPTADGCVETQAECSVSTWSIGLQAQYHLSVESETDFWVGGGLGYESLAASQEPSFSGTEVSLTLSGAPQVLLQAGVDLDGDPAMAFGPYISLTLSRFNNLETEVSGDDVDASAEDDIDDTVVHGWLTVGFRGTFVL